MVHQMAFLLSGLFTAAATAYLADKAYDGASGVYMYLAEKWDAVKSFPEKTRDKLRKSKVEKTKTKSAAYRRLLRAKYDLSKK